MDSGRVGLFGGTFDPPHLGHVAALEASARSGRFDRIVVTVAGDPYYKSAVATVRPAPRRLAMAHAAFDGLDLIEVSDREIVREGPSYTVETVRELLTGCDTVDLIVGADLASQLDTWHEASALADLVRVGVVPRPRWRWYEIDMAPVDLSSSFIREHETEPARLRDYLPELVIPLFLAAPE